MNFAGKGEFGARHQTNRLAEVIDIGKTARSRTEITRHELVTHFRGPRPHALETKVTHRRLHLLPGMAESALTPLTPVNDSPSHSCLSRSKKFEWREP